MDRETLVGALEDRFDGSETAVRAVSRQARDLGDAALLREDEGYELTAGAVVDHLQDAPEGYTVVERWNWWIGSLELAHGDAYRRFRVRSDIG